MRKAWKRMNRNIFRKYDIRGVYPRDLDQDSIRRLGYALSVTAGPGGSIAIGRDCRPSGADLHDNLAAGAAAGGARLVDLGVQTTPMTYFAAHTLRPEVTVMITGSHNPPEYNGFKIMKGLHTMHGSEISDLADIASAAPAILPGHPVSRGEAMSVREAYKARLMAEFSFDRPFEVVVDAGNGTGGIACEVLEALGCRVVPLFCEMDGRFPNHHPNPTVEANLEAVKKAVGETRADLGLAYDGDADRLGVVDDLGRTVFGDRTLTLLAAGLLEANPGAAVISEVKASGIFFDTVERLGGRPLMRATGHSIIKQAMLDEDALLAGEMSGHIFFRDRYYGFDDALYASLRLLEVVGGSGRRLSELLAGLPQVISTPEIREDCTEEQKFGIVDRVRQILSKSYDIVDIDGVRVRFAEGWGLVRASNTQPVLVLRFEAATQELLESYEKIVRKAIAEAREGA